MAAAFAGAEVGVVVLEKSKALGGVWYHYANPTSRVNSSEPSYRLPLQRPSANVNHSPRHQILADILRVVSQYRLRQHTYCQTNVRRVSANDEQCYAVAGLFGVQQYPFTIACQAVILCTNRRLGTPREIKYAGETSLFEGQVRRGLAGDTTDLHWQDEVVIVIGMGAFAVENMRTALEHGAAHVSFVCRRRGSVCPQIVDWINFVRPVDEDFRSSPKGDAVILAGWQSAYDVGGAHRPECWATGALKPDGHTVSVSDLFFVAHWLGLVTSQLAEVERFVRDGVRTHGGLLLRGSSIIKCVGFTTQDCNERMAGRSLMGAAGMVHQRVWLLAEPHLDARVFSNPFGSSVLNSYSFASKMMVRKWSQPELVERLPPSTQLMRINHFTAAELHDADMAAQSSDIKACEMMRAHLEEVATRFEETMPLSKYVSTNARQWHLLFDMYSTCEHARQTKRWEYPFAIALSALEEEGLYLACAQDVSKMIADCQPVSSTVQAVSAARVPSVDEVLAITRTHLELGVVLGADTPFVDAGLDSLAVVDFHRSLRDAVGGTVELPLTLIHDAPTGRALVEALGRLVCPEGVATSSRICNPLHVQTQPAHLTWLADPGVVQLDGGDDALAALVVLPSVFGTVTHWGPFARKLPVRVWGVEHEYIQAGREEYLHRVSLGDDAEAFGTLVLSVCQQEQQPVGYQAVHFVGSSVGATLAQMTAVAFFDLGGRILAVVLIDPPPPGPPTSLVPEAASRLELVRASAIQHVRQAQQLVGRDVNLEVVAEQLANCDGEYEVAHVTTEELGRLGLAQVDRTFVKALLRKLFIHVHNLQRWAALPVVPVRLETRMMVTMKVVTCTRRHEFYGQYFASGGIERLDLYGAHELLPAVEGEHLLFVNHVCVGRVPEVTNVMICALHEGEENLGGW